MLGLGIRKAVKKRVKALLGRADAPAAQHEPVGEAVPPQPASVAPAPAVPAQPPAQAAPPQAAAAPAQADAGRPLTREAIEDVLDSFIRPALQSDGGDIALVDIVGAEVHVRLVGSCADCPSSIATVKMGVERLLMEEFPSMRSLVAVG